MIRMKTRALQCIAAMMIVGTVLTAQPPIKILDAKEKRLEYAKKNFIMGLRSDNYGVIESTLMMIAKMKITNRFTGISDLQLVIDSLSIASPLPSLRYKAFLVSAVCSDPEWFSAETRLNTSEMELFFLNTSQRLQQKMLGLSSL